MPMLVIPERTVHTIIDRAALADLVQRRKLGWKLHGNLRQLLGFDAVGADRNKRGEAGGKGLENKYYRFEDVSWFYNPEVATAVPLFGSQREKHSTLKATFGITFSEDTFNRVTSSDPPSRVVEGWQRRRGPQLGDGASLIGLPSSRLLDALPAVPSPERHAMPTAPPPSCATSAANPAATPAMVISAATASASTTNGVEPPSTEPPSTAPPSTVPLSAGATADPIEAAIAAVRCAITPP
jgi:hypothetical protein